MPKENNKMQVDIDTLKKQNVNDLLSIKELYSKLGELGEKIKQIKYIDNTLLKKLKKEYERLKETNFDVDTQVKIINDIKTINEKLTNNIETINEKINNDNETINEKLDTKAKESDLIVERNRINLLTKLQNGETEGNTELLDIRIGVDGNVYGTAGEAIREQINNNKLTNILDISTNILNAEECIENASVGWGNGGYYLNVIDKTATNFCLSPIINVKEGETFIFNHKGYQTNIYLSDNTFKINANNMLTIEKNTPFTIPPNITCMRYKFTINSSNMNNGQWKNKVMLCKSNVIPSKFIPYGVKTLKTNIDIPLYVKKTESIQFLNIDKRSGKLLGDKAIVVPSFDGMNINTFDTVTPYMKEKGLPFTIFSNGDVSNDLIKRFQSASEYGGEIQFYNGQPALTYEGTNNYIEQYKQFKDNYETFLQIGVGKPKFLAYSGGRHTTITEKIARQFGIKWARTTEADWSAPKKWNDELFNTPAFFMNNTNYTTMINISDWDIQNNMIRPFLTHSLLSDTVTDASFNIEWKNFKQVLDKLYELKENGSIYVMNYSQLFDFLRFPKDVEVGQHVLMFEADGKEHEYVKTNDTWRELTV